MPPRHVDFLWRRERPLTICIAAMGSTAPDQHIIICAADRMITAADVQAVPEQMKTFQLTHHILALLAGDASPQVTIGTATHRRVTSLGSAGETPHLI